MYGTHFIAGMIKGCYFNGYATVKDSSYATQD